MKALRLYINALHFGAMGIILGGMFASRQLLRLLPVIGLRAFLGMLAFITVGAITIFFLNMATIGKSYVKASEHRWFGSLVLLLFVGFAVGLGTMWINLVRD